MEISTSNSAMERNTRAMSATKQRDQAISLAKSRPEEALELARQVNDPWFRAQALSWVARFTDGDVLAIASEAAKAAAECDDNYKQSAARAWEIAALAERDHIFEARKCLCDILPAVKHVEPASSRSEALLLLLQAGAKIANEDAEKVYEVMKTSCQPEQHWRCSRALRDGAKMISGELQPRPFFW
ncbi:hypothetical protein [Massilia niastensis]|uniref:hypothetical protein n=1 Tax=Massilia niastensis TaxID=544911 RepID=UPI00146CB77A|nr:hypothetical protein [Massilia niastensis]